MIIGGRTKEDIERRIKLIRADFVRLDTDSIREKLFNKQSGRCITNCLRWNIRRGKPCTCGKHG